MTTKTAKG